MDSLVLQRTDSNSSSLRSGSEKENEENIPTWKLPLTSSLINKARQSSLLQQDDATTTRSKRDSVIPKTVQISPELAEDEATAQLILILLPCIICNRTFSPQALERHSKICASVNIKDPKVRGNRGTFDSSEQRKKDTPIADYIPPPPLDSNGEFIRQGSRRLRDSFSRGSKGRSSLGKTSTAATTIATTSPAATSAIPTWRRSSRSPHKTAAPPVTLDLPKHVEPFENTSEFGSEESQDSKSGAPVPSYARALSPSEDCPYCGRNFTIKAYERHVKFCHEIYVRKQYEHQPIPKEKEEAMERQEIRTKYKPLKASTSCGSLRSMSPPKDFPSMMAMKFYGFMNKTFSRNNFKKSNESIANSCYGDYTRGMRKTSPAPSMASTISNKPAGLYQRSNTTMHSINSKGSPVMRVNTTSNIPKRTKSIENLNLANVTSSGYGQQYMSNNSGNSFNRNSKTRSSLHKNFFRNSSKRVEPEGTENTSSPDSSSPGALIITPMSFYSKGKNYSSLMMQSAHEPMEESRYRQQQPKPLNVSNNLMHSTHNTLLMNHHNNSQSSIRHHGGVGGGGGGGEDSAKNKTLLSSDPTYDPYEKAAKQFEELLKSQPARKVDGKQSNRSQGRKVGLDRAFRSVTEPFKPECNDEDPERKPISAQNNEQSMNRGAASTQNNNNNHKSSSGLSKYGMNDNNMKTEMNSFVFNPSDDSYWDQILKKSNANSSTSSQEAQDDSQPTSDSDNGKSRAVSNISSVDSAFSRSDGTDLEFEALETLMSLGDVPQQQQKQSSVVSSHGEGGGGSGSGGSILPAVIDSKNNSRRQSSTTISLSPLSSAPSTNNCQQLFGESSPEMSKTKTFTDSTCLPMLSNNNSTQAKGGGAQPESNSLFSSFQKDPREENKMNLFSNKSFLHSGAGVVGSANNSNHNNNSSGNLTLAKFCHECGTPYPTSTAKFCPECGERRAMK